jgi:hypothetical protein
VTIRLRGRRWPVANATVAGGGVSATTDADGFAGLTFAARARGVVRLVATKQALRPGFARVTVR